MPDRKVSPPVPTYVAIADRLTDDLAGLEPGTRLPSEHELATREKVSRDTARAALQELERRHLVRRSNGSGTFVAPRIAYRVGPGTPPSWTAAIRESGATPRMEVLELTRIDDPDDELREALELAPGSAALRRTTRGFVDEVAATVMVAHIPADLAPGLDEQLALGGSLYSLCVSLGFQPRRDWGVSQLDVVDHQTARWLELIGRPSTWHGESRLSDAHTGRPLLYTTSWSRPDVIHIRIEEHARGRRPAPQEHRR
jgi:GntR family transcriptional regulator